jgi:RNA polymerase sigma factor (sigma-70 family)
MSEGIPPLSGPAAAGPNGAAGSNGAASTNGTAATPPALAGVGRDLPLQELLERHLPDLRAYLRRRARGLLAARESASDLAQSVCREVIEHVDRFEHGAEESFRAWLYRTAERKLVSRYRYYTAIKRDGGPAEGEGPLPPTPSQQVSAREELAAAEAALARLEAPYREAILLSRIEGLSHAEIARRMGRSEGAVRNLVYRGLAQVAKELGRS